MSTDHHTENGSPSLLSNSTILVAGGTGRVGGYIVRGLLERGARVVVPSRSPEKLDALEERLEAPLRERLVRIQGNASDEGEAPRLREEALAANGSLEGVVASLGSFIPAPSTLGASRADFEHVIEHYLVAHFQVARAFMPLLLEAGRGSYTFVNGPLALAPRPGSGLVSAATAGQAMLARAVMRETAESGVRVNELMLSLGIGWGTPEETERHGGWLGRYMAYLVSDAADGVRGETVELRSGEQLEGLPA